MGLKNWVVSHHISAVSKDFQSSWQVHSHVIDRHHVFCIPFVWLLDLEWPLVYN